MTSKSNVQDGRAAASPWWWGAISGAALAVSPAPVSAQVPSITFDEVPAGTQANVTYRPKGVVLGCLKGSIGHCSNVAEVANPGAKGGPAQPAPQVLTVTPKDGSSAWPAINERDGYLTVHFLSPVSQVSIQALRYKPGSAASMNKPFMQAFGSANQLLATVEYPDGATDWRPLALTRPQADIQYVVLSSYVTRDSTAAWGLFDNLSYSPMPLPQWLAVSAGNAFSMGLRTDGSLWTWGAGQRGQLGNGGTLGTGTPQKVGGNDWQAISAGREHALAMKQDGTLWAWGNGAAGRLGDGGTTDRPVPVRVGGWADWVAFAAGPTHSLGVRREQITRPYFGESLTLWAWGANNDGQLGDGGKVDRASPQVVPTLFGIGALAASHGVSIVSVESALQSPTSAWQSFSWGQNGAGQLGVGDRVDSAIPRTILQPGFTRLAIGDGHVLALEGSSKLWTWGYNANGQLGMGSTQDLWLPTRVPATPGQPAFAQDSWQEIAAGAAHSAAIKTDGSLWTWGRNTQGQLGDGSTTDRPLPTPVGGGKRWVAVAAGFAHTLAIDADGALWAWGQNDAGQLGDHTTTGHAMPQPAGFWVVRSESSTHGRITPLGQQPAAHQSVLRFTLAADPGYAASASGCGGTLVGAVFTTAPITGDCTVQAQFTGARANLVVSRFTVPRRVTAGRPVALAYTVTNRGTLAAEPSTTCLSYGLSSMPSLRPRNLACRAAPALAAGAEFAETVRVVLPPRLLNGRYRLTATADASLQVDESDETDNAATATMQVGN
ncbi:CARDB domain-containing protein [Ideonella sp. A 288]|uniref:CARDB domain-containing protein n=1 Tax=Ideonella sp. A 288 TaxID=1962181 RepID=UPI00130379E3|nr:CARDB domain-containing protein [Ideonella sp. A 288]